MHYGEPTIRIAVPLAVPLAIGLVSASNPQLPILDTLSKYSHDNDLQVTINTIFAMGLRRHQMGFKTRVLSFGKSFGSLKYFFNFYILIK